jgi:protein O-mannosyl-transferase
MPVGATASKQSGRAVLSSLWIIAAGGIIVLAALVAYHNCFAAPFIFDDIESIFQNRTIHHLWPIWQALSPPQAKGFTVTGRPLLNLSLAVNYAFGGNSPWGYHAVNLVIHILTGLTLFGIARGTFERPVLREQFGASSLSLGLAVAVLWTVHPLQTEVVTYVVQRAESLMGLFYLLTLYCFIRGTGSGKSGLWFTGSLVACLLGMATKEVMASAPLMVLLYDRTFIAGSFAEAWRRRGRWYIVLGCTWVVLGCLLAQTSGRGGTAGFGTIVSWPQYALTQCWAIAHYLWLAVWPRGLVFDYGILVFRDPSEILPQMLLLIVLLAGTVLGLVYRPRLGFLGAWFFVILAPSSSVIPVGSQTIAEHRMYLPLGAVIVLLSVGAFALGRKFLGPRLRIMLGWGVGGGLAVLLAMLTIQRNRDYETELAIWQDTVTKCPNNPRAHENLGAALERAHRLPEAIAQYEQALRITPDYAEVHNVLGLALVGAGRVREGIVQYEEALRLQPDFAEAHNNLAIALFGLGKRQEAVGHFEQALRFRPDFDEAHYNLGNALARSGKLGEAILQYQEALRITPEYPESHYSMAGVLVAQRKTQEAIAHYEEAIRLKPDYVEAHYSLGGVLLRMGKVPEAIGQYEEALRLKKDSIDLQNNLAWVLATVAPAEGGDPTRAVSLAEHVCESTSNRVAAFADTLAAAYAGAGRFPEAVTTAQKAIELANSTGQTQLVKEVEAHLELYRAGHPYRESTAVTPGPPH